MGSPTGIIVGRRAPDFELACTSAPAHPARIARLEDYRDRWMVLMFYPQDFSLVCPTELSAMSDRYNEFAEHNAGVLAISTDSIESHERWIATGRAQGGLGPIRYPLVSDPTGDVARSYNIYAESQHVALRGLFIIDPNSVVQYQLVHNLSTGRRVQEILRVLKALQMGGLCAENWTPGQAAIDPAVELKPGSVISHYRIEETLGTGGCATVYRAYDGALERDVALKVLKNVDGKPPTIHDEARAAAALSHPNVCTIYNIEDTDGMAVIVMEYLVGRSLRDLIADGPLPRKELDPIACQIAEGMRAAHDVGVVHRDLKPANIMLTNQGVVKILDFGIARRRRVTCPTESNATITCTAGGLLSGTPSYMSPEQAGGDRTTAASDVFSFGLVLYELLTGKKAVTGQTDLEILDRIRHIQPDDISETVDEPYRALLRRMLVRDPGARTITMSEIKDTLRRTELKTL